MFFSSGKNSAARLSIWTRCGVTLWAVSQRRPEAPLRPAETSGRHVPPKLPPPPPPSPLIQLLSSLSFFFFFVSSNYKHMWTVSTSCCQAKGLCCFSLWAQHFGTLGQFWALKGASAPELVLLRGPQQAGKCDLALEKIKEPVLYCL